MKLRNKKTGEIIETDFELSVSVPDDEKLYGNDTYTQIKGYSSIKELSEEWEDYEEPKQGYWFIDYDGRIHKEDYAVEEEYKDMAEIGNYFETKEEAEKAVEKLKAWKRLKDKDFQFHGHNALGVGEITFSLDFEDMDDEGEIGQLRHDLDLLFGGEE